VKIYDVVIIGGGPVGSTVAKELAEKGKSVLVLEKRSAIGFPNHCSGLVSEEFISFANVDKSLILNEIYGASLYSYTNKIFSFRDNKNHAVVIDRPLFDRQLANSAIKNGVEYIFDSRVKSIERIGNGLRIYFKKNFAQSVDTHLLVIASGARSGMLHLTGFNSVKGETIHTLQVEAKIELPDSDIVYMYINNSVTHNWFAWAIPVGNGRVRIGLGTDRRENLLALFDSLTRNWALLRSKKIVPESKVAWLIPIGFMDKPFRDNIIVVGDAAREVKPFSGGGLYTGIMAAHFAAEAVLTALEKKDYSKRMLSHYVRLCNMPVRNEIKKGVILRKLYKSMSDIEKEKFLLSLNDEHAKKIILDSGHIDHPFYVGYKLLKYIKSPLFYYLKSHIFTS